jgi:hypothetical protein
MATPTLNDFTTALVAKIQAAQQNNGSLTKAADAVVMREDAHDLDAEINKKIGEIGMIILVGQPYFVNSSKQTNPTVQAIVKTAIAIGEAPVVWRDEPLTKLTAADISLLLTQLLHSFQVPGFSPLIIDRANFIPDKKRQLYELPVEAGLLAPHLNN